MCMCGGVVEIGLFALACGWCVRCYRKAKARWKQ